MAVFVLILSYSSSLLQTNDLELREKIFWNNATGKTIFWIASKFMLLSVNWRGSSVLIFVLIFIFYFLLNLLQTILNGNNFLKHIVYFHLECFHALFSCIILGGQKRVFFTKIGYSVMIFCDPVFYCCQSIQRGVLNRVFYW